MAAPLRNDCDDDVPPLEDMSDLLEQVKEIQKTKSPSLKKPLTSAEDIKTLNTETRSHGIKLPEVQQRKEKKAQPKGKDDSFMGLKKGFLLGGFGDDKPKAKRKENNIPTIKPKLDKKEDSFKIKEVQDALQRASPLLQNKDWLSSDLLDKVEKHPYLAEVMANPDFTSVLSKFEKDPKGAAEQLHNNPQLQHIFRDFCAILGDHFTSLPGTPDAPQSTDHLGTSSQTPSPGIKTMDETGLDMKVRSSTDPKQPTADDEARMKQILSDPEVCNVLADEKIKQLMEALRCNPNEAQEIIRSATPDLKKKVKKLVEVGLLSFSS
ncbi:uncharacterized protein [Apostichopus japonicus]|uniref:uncharacterized protein n=1 Tax=Stichopus japonicus TaxID=307972 RepID=UPI003AB26394